MKVDRRPGSGVAKIHIEDDGSYFQVSQDGGMKKLEKAKISLDDCLACSGCVTSAETVLITQQSHEELRKVLGANKTAAPDQQKLVVISVSPQSRASLAVRFQLNPTDTARKLTAFFKKIGAHYVFDTAFSRNFSLLESQREFVRRFRGQANPEQALPVLTSACPGWICYAEKTHGSTLLPHISTARSPQQVMGSLVKDFFAQQQRLTPDKVYHVTVMPCYDKKLEASRPDFFSQEHQTRDVDCVITTGEVSKLLEEEGVSLAELEPAPLDSLYVVTGRVGRAVSSPSTGCSPPGCPKGPDGWQKGPRPLTQALAASLFPRLASLGPSCASVSKMLELPTTGRWSSELTLTSHRSELPGQVVRQGGQSFASQASSRHTFKALGSMAHLRLRKQTLSNLRQRLLRGLGGQRPQHHLRPGLFPRCSSASAQEPTSHRGGGSGGYLEHVFRHAAQELFGIHVTEVTYRPLRNKDLQEVILEREGQVLLHFAAAYGFRNIQNLVQKLKRGRCPYHYVEVMACPAGCLNGGGQLKAPDTPGKELLQQVERLYGLVRTEAPEDAAGVQELYECWLQGAGSERAGRLLHTSYHAVEKAGSGLSIRW
ncbi:PREDICTED: cytosolic Fe-S cluster assembly factor NARFL isoform X2 [Capra hircus]|nr:PREDICTED: cytosolic Fe-S cluster assembly factor NARFL isoform X2 [Capra hircus]